jgi:regulator of protease activity HflC (stomatin/prohibitin superfamily)
VYAVESFEKGILLIDGKFSKVLDTGVYYFWKNAVVISVMKADLRQLQLEVSGQEILTRDKAALRVNFYTQYKVVDIIKALIENKDYEKQLYILMQLALREFIGTLSLDELLEKKESISAYVLATLKDKAFNLGVEVRDCGVRDIILPGEVKEIMNQVLVAQKKAEANVIMRREETASTRSLLNTAKLMEENSMLFKLKEMEYVEKIADKINSISLSGGNQIIDQLKDIFVPKK